MLHNKLNRNPSVRDTDGGREGQQTTLRTRRSEFLYELCIHMFYEVCTMTITQSVLTNIMNYNPNITEN